ncbi:MAG: TetR/AcrR family transcriptional regulator [Aeromonadaceae bacterium]|nr:TetR/AcrR family transcriptional regulator [Aeromonadaceae bacterium]
MQYATEQRRRTRLSPDERNRQLMAHAIAVFARRGLGRAGHAEIAERAGVSVATVFNYFNTREDLVDAVLTEIENHLYSMARSAHESGFSAQECFRLHIEQYVDAAYDKSDYNLIALEWGASIRDDVWPRFAQCCERLQSMATRTLQRGMELGEFRSKLDCEHIAQLLSSINYSASQMIYQSPQPPREEVKEFMLKSVRLAMGML